jgi:acyl dehydratase
MIDARAAGRTFPALTVGYDWRDCALYALGVGATAEELDLLYEGRGPKVLPTFAVIPLFRATRPAVAALGVPQTSIIHGEQRIVLHRPLAPKDTLSIEARVSAIYDKGEAGAVAVIESEARGADGAPAFRGRSSIFARGQGGFGGDRGPKAEEVSPPERAPDFAVTETTRPEQALLYRLSGDLNPLHADPDFARTAGFARPILHGLCTFGFAGRALVRGACGGDVARLRSFGVRFAGVVMPGDALTTEGWRLEGGRWAVRTKTGSGRVVLANAVADVAG